MKISAIVVTYNGSKWIYDCLNSLRTSEVPLQTIVIDNMSKDDTCEIVSEHFPEVKLVKSENNLGFGKANNLGIKIATDAKADYFFLLNQDAFIEANSISNLINAAQNNSDYGVLSPIHCIWEKNQLDRAFTNYVSVKNNPNFLSDFVLNNEKKEIYSVPFVAASGWLLTKRCIEIVGGFDPMFFYLGEDVNYCQRVLYHNLKIGVVPNSIFYHDTKTRGEKSITKESQNHYFDYTNKMKFGNLLNKDIKVEGQNIKNHLKKLIAKQLLTLKFSKAQDTFIRYKKINSIIKITTESRKINAKIGRHYI